MTLWEKGSRSTWTSSANWNSKVWPSAPSISERWIAAAATSSTRTLDRRCLPLPGMARREVGRENTFPAPSVHPGPYTVHVFRWDVERTVPLAVLPDVSAADGELAHAEVVMLRQLTTALGLEQSDYNALQSKHKDKLSLLRNG